MNDATHEPQSAAFTQLDMEKLFYFCLKRTGSRQEAEELAAEVALAVVAQLRHGVKPENFHAWVWQIAHNHCHDWAVHKRRRQDLQLDADIGDLELADETPEPLDDLIRDEMLDLLRRELAFISSEYRDILVAYYIRGCTVGQIAQTLGLPEGTVKSKLHRARKRLKEGMDMARTFGKLSYAPESVSFLVAGSEGGQGEPWCYTERKLCQNIMLTAYRTPSTAEELAIEVGVALPYMEEELAGLVSATLMRKTEGKYETNVIIIGTRTQDRIFAHMRGIVPELTQSLIQAMEYKTAWYDANCPGWRGGEQTREDMKWAQLMFQVDCLTEDLGRGIYSQRFGELSKPPASRFTQRPGGGKWDVVGLAACNGSRPAPVGRHGAALPPVSGMPRVNFIQYKFTHKNIDRLTPHLLTYSEALALTAIANESTEVLEEQHLERLLEYGYIRKTGNGYALNFCVMFHDRLLPLPPEIQAEYDAILALAKKLALRHYEFCRAAVLEEAPEMLRDDVHQVEFSSMLLASTRDAVFEEALHTGYLTYNDEEAHRMLGALLLL